MTALLRFKSCALAIADFIIGMFMEEDRPAHDHESIEYSGPERDEKDGAWWI